MRKQHRQTMRPRGMPFYPKLPDESDDQIVFPAGVIQTLAPEYEVWTTGMTHILGMSRHVVWRRIHRRQNLPQEYQARAMGAIRIYALALQLNNYRTARERQEARRWLNDWLRAPSLAFGWKRPIELMETAEGQVKVATLLARLAAGVYV